MTLSRALFVFLPLLHADDRWPLEDTDGVSLPVPDVLVQGEDAEEGKEDTSGPKEVPEDEVVAKMEPHQMSCPSKKSRNWQSRFISRDSEGDSSVFFSFCGGKVVMAI